MKFEYIKESDKIAFKFKNEIICLDEFLIVDDKVGDVKDKDGKRLFVALFGDRSMLALVNSFAKECCTRNISNIKTFGPQDYIEGVGNIMLSNYLDKIIKMFKVYLKEECIDVIKNLKTEQDVAKNIEDFKNKIKLLDNVLEESVKIKEYYKNFQNLKNKEIAEIEKMF